MICLSTSISYPNKLSIASHDTVILSVDAVINMFPGTSLKVFLIISLLHCPVPLSFFARIIYAC